MARGGQSTAAAAMESLLDGLDHSTRIREHLAMAFWDRVVGPQIAAASEPESVRDGVMIVRTKSSVWSQELSFMRGKIISRLNGQVGKPVIRELIFRAHGIAKEQALFAELFPSEEELVAIRLDSVQQNLVDSEIGQLVAIADESIRESVARRLVREAQLRVWRLSHGWTTCRQCNSLYHTSDSVCPICKISGE